MIYSATVNIDAKCQGLWSGRLSRSKKLQPHNKNNNSIFTVSSIDSLPCSVAIENLLSHSPIISTYMNFQPKNSFGLYS